MKIPGYALLLVLMINCGGGGGSQPNGPAPANDMPAGSGGNTGSGGDGGDNSGGDASEPRDFVAFETVPTRPMVQVGDRLFVTNPQDNRVEAYNIGADKLLAPSESISVGMEPSAIAARNANEIWVVNHLSDSVSVVDISVSPARVTRTMLVGDEPRDIVFAQDRAFITTAHRGQHRTHASLAGVDGAGDPATHTPGTPRADVWVFDASNPGDEPGGRPLKIIELFGDTPRALASSPDGSTVYAAVFHSGNQTSLVHEGVMCYGFSDDDPGAPLSGAVPCAVKDGISSSNGPPGGVLPGGRPAPGANVDGVPQPWTSMIVKFDPASGEWRDVMNRNFSNGIRFNLPDQDVFAIDSAALTVTRDFRHVGTTLFNLAVNPVSGRVYVTNTDAQNHVRFEGPGVHGGTTVQGNIARARITVLDAASGQARARHLNSHIDYSVLKAPASTKTHSIATPLQMAVSIDGTALYVAALGSNKIAVYRTDVLEDDEQWADFDPTVASARHINVSGGPVGVLLDEPRGRLYVMTHVDHAVVVVDLASGAELQRLSMPNPEPAALSAGRFMLYDAQRSSSNGEASCASCHVFGDLDQLAWNLGNPDASNSRNPQPQPTRNITELGCSLVGPNDPTCSFLSIVNGDGDLEGFAAMKGPMTTQTLRGTATHGHMHWRGDRSNGYFGIDSEQTGDERLSFKNFIVAFEGLLGLDVELPAAVTANDKSAAVVALEQDVDKFADFMLAVQLPPNPHIDLDRTHSASAQIGRSFFTGERRSDGVAGDFSRNGPEPDGVNCAGCHTFNPAQGFFGTDGNVAHGGEILMLKVPHFRNLYQKVGMFGLPDREGFLPSTTHDHQGDQIRGFGFLHDGATDRLFNFLQGSVFDNGEEGCPPGLNASHGCTLNQGFIGIPDDSVRLGLVDFLMEFDTDLAPIVGQQITLNASTQNAATLERLRLLETRAASTFVSKILGGTVTECDLVAHGEIHGEVRAYLYDTATSTYTPDKAGEERMTPTQLRDSATTDDHTLTFTCVPPGSGTRSALDRDRDGVLNRDE
ncbi:MAG: YncE family protein [Pseudomonadales bacterium]